MIRVLVDAVAIAVLMHAAPILAQSEKGQKAEKSSILLPAWRDRVNSDFRLRSEEGLEYRIFVSMPSGIPPADGYPTFYVLDGNAWFGTAAEIARIYEANYGPSMVVGVGYPENIPINSERRGRDFTLGPPALPPFFKLSDDYGGAVAFRKFLTSPLRRALAERYPVGSSKHILFGHSLGGLFALETYLDAPETFDTYIAASPAIWFNREHILSRIAELSGRTPSRHPKIFLQMGGLEQTMTKDLVKMATVISGPHGPFSGKPTSEIVELVKARMSQDAMVDNVKEVAALLTKQGAPADLVIFDGEDHLSVIPASLSRGMAEALREGKVQ